MVTDEVAVQKYVLRVWLRNPHLKKNWTREHLKKQKTHNHCSLLIYTEFIRVNIEFCVLFRYYINIYK